jgi:hypothetical protein
MSLVQKCACSVERNKKQTESLDLKVSERAMKHFTEAAKDLNVSLCAKTSWHEQPQNRASLSTSAAVSPAKSMARNCADSAELPLPNLCM